MNANKTNKTNKNEIYLNTLHHDAFKEGMKLATLEVDLFYAEESRKAYLSKLGNEYCELLGRYKTRWDALNDERYQDKVCEVACVLGDIAKAKVNFALAVAKYLKEDDLIDD